MAQKSVPAGVVPSDGAVQLFNSILRASYARIFATFETNSLATNGRRKEAMRQIEQIAQETGVDLSAWLDVEARAFYEMGMFDTMKGLHDEGVPVRIDKAFAHFHEQALQALAEVGISDIAKSMQGLVSTGQNLISNAARQAVLEQVATGQLLGESRQKIKKNIVEQLKKNGVSALVDKGGRTWELARYGDMLARTKMTQAHNSGSINRMAESGYDLVQVSDHQGECPLCRPWEGKILSVTGKTKGHDSLSKAESAGLFHPNCRHTITPAHAEFLQSSLVWDTETQQYVPYGTQGKQGTPAPAMVTPPKDAVDGVRKDVKAEISKLGRDLKIELSDFQANFIKDKGIVVVADTKSKNQRRLGYYMDTRTSITINKSAAAKDRDLDQTFYHELGHAVDYQAFANRLTNQPEWIKLSHDEKRAIAEYRLEKGLLKTIEKYSVTDEERAQIITGKQIRRDVTFTRKDGREAKGYVNLAPGRAYMAYVRSNKEVFADGYGQFITDPKAFKKRAPEVYGYFKELEKNYGKN